MRLSNGVEWSMHCCVSLSLSNRPTSAARLAELHGVAPAYLAKHLQALSRAGLVASQQGQEGGYRLTQPADQITVLDVVLAVNGDSPAFRCTEIRQNGPLAVPAERCATPCAVARAMADAETAWRSALSVVTIADLARSFDADSGGTATRDIRTWLNADHPGVAHERIVQSAPSSSAGPA